MAWARVTPSEARAAIQSKHLGGGPSVGRLGDQCKGRNGPIDLMKSILIRRWYTQRLAASPTKAGFVCYPCVSQLGKRNWVVNGGCCLSGRGAETARPLPWKLRLEGSGSWSAVHPSISGTKRRFDPPAPLRVSLHMKQRGSKAHVLLKKGMG